MDFKDRPDHLTQIETIAQLMAEAKGEGDPAKQARKELVLLYYGAAFRYILAILRDETTAQEIAQNFAVRFMQGDFVRKANPGRGRFRDYLKRSLHNLVIDHYRAGKGPRPLPDNSSAFSPAEQSESASDAHFRTSLREELLARTWDALAAFEKTSGVPYHCVLRYKSEHPDERSGQVAKVLGARLGKSFTEASMRQLIHRSREKFIEMLLEQAALVLDAADQEKLEEVLAELELMEYCRPVLEKRGRKA
jgi:RNA polymerase sigma-70 factor (ECF subfamily)